MPKISVFMAAYNSASYIEEAITSILHQTFQNFELLIVNDGSTDSTGSIIRSFSDSRIKLIENPINRGLLYSRNLALIYAQGDYIAVMDSDDIASPHRLEKQYKIFQQRPNLALLGSYAYVIDQNGNKTSRTIITCVGSDKIRVTLLFSNEFVHSSTMIRSTVFKEMNGYQNHSLAEDYSLFTRIALKYEVDNIPEYLISYRVHDNNISRLKLKDLEEMHYPILAQQLQQLDIDCSRHNLEIILTPFSMSKFTLNEYHKLYKTLITSNRKIKAFPILEFERILCEKWCELVMRKSKKDAIFQLFRTPIFQKKFVTAKQIRKAFKYSIKHFLSIQKS